MNEIISTSDNNDSKSLQISENQPTPKISVIVPVYKVEQYLPQCIESILNQTFTDFELLLIDDGSPDNSGQICDEYAANDSRIRVFHKENGGASSARNLGLKNAQGDLIIFVDADDWIDDSAMNLIVDYFTRYNLDFLLFEVCSVEKNGYRYETNYLEYDVLLDRNSFILNYVGGFSPCCGVYRRDIFIKNNLFFYEGIIKEDIELLPKYFYYSDRFFAIKDHLYFYNKLNESSVTSQLSLESKRISIVSDYVIAIRFIEFLENQEDIDQFYSDYIFNKLIIVYFRLFFRGALGKSIISPGDVILIYNRFKCDYNITFSGGRLISRIFNIIVNLKIVFYTILYINYYFRSDKSKVREFSLQNKFNLINEKNLHSRY